jgi:hypothetical protein
MTDAEGGCHLRPVFFPSFLVREDPILLSSVDASVVRIEKM